MAPTAHRDTYPSPLYSQNTGNQAVGSCDKSLIQICYKLTILPDLYGKTCHKGRESNNNMMSFQDIFYIFSYSCTVLVKCYLYGAKPHQLYAPPGRSAL